MSKRNDGGTLTLTLSLFKGEGRSPLPAGGERIKVRGLGSVRAVLGRRSRWSATLQSGGLAV
jgi:hypothetical protein